MLNHINIVFPTAFLKFSLKNNVLSHGGFTISQSVKLFAVFSINCEILGKGNNVGIELLIPKYLILEKSAVAAISM